MCVQCTHKRVSRKGVVGEKYGGLTIRAGPKENLEGGNVSISTNRNGLHFKYHKMHKLCHSAWAREDWGVI